MPVASLVAGAVGVASPDAPAAPVAGAAAAAPQVLVFVLCTSKGSKLSTWQRELSEGFAYVCRRFRHLSLTVSIKERHGMLRQCYSGRT